MIQVVNQITDAWKLIKHRKTMLQVAQDILNLPEIGIKMKKLEKEKEDEKKNAKDYFRPSSHEDASSW